MIILYFVLVKSRDRNSSIFINKYTQSKVQDHRQFVLEEENFNGLSLYIDIDSGPMSSKLGHSEKSISSDMVNKFWSFRCVIMLAGFSLF